MSNERRPIMDRALTSDEINEKVLRMMTEKARQDAKAVEQDNQFSSASPL